MDKKNPFSSMFWAVQGMAEELSKGALIILKIKQLNQKISMLVLRNEAQFTKKAKLHLNVNKEFPLILP